MSEEVNSRYKYVFHHVLTRAFLGEFMVKEVAFNSPLKGAGGQFTGVIPIAKRQPADTVKAATALDLTAVYVIYQDETTNTETFLWGGIIVEREWDPRKGEVKIEAVEWKSWFYTKEYAPQITSPYANRKVSYTAIDQMILARAWLYEAITWDGAPDFTIDVSSGSPRLRDLNVNAFDHKMIGDLIDSMANRTDGFDWGVEVRKSSVDQLPELVATLWYPERGTVTGLTMDHTSDVFERTQDGRGNILDYGTWPESAKNKRSRVWATGAGTPPDQPVAMDDDPGLELGQVLLRETMINRNSVVSPATLSEHAQAERAFLGVQTESVDIALKPNHVKPTDFFTGDRVSLRIRDGWLDIDQTAIRITDKAIAPFSKQEGERIVATLDLSDYTQADPDEGDTV